MQSPVNENSVSSPNISSSLNLSESTSTVIMEGSVQGPELELWYALLHEKGDHWCIKRCLWGDLLHFLISVCERIKPGPFAATDCHPGNRLLGDLCQMLLLKAGQGPLISTVGLYAFTVCVSVCVCVYSLMSGSTLCPPGVQHHTRVAYWEILLPVIHTYMLAFYTLHSLRDPQCPHTTFIQGVSKSWKSLKHWSSLTFPHK